MSKAPVEKGDVYKDNLGISVYVADLQPSERTVTVAGVNPGSKIKRTVTLEALELEYTKVPHAVAPIPEIPKHHMDKIKAYQELITIASQQMVQLLNAGLQEPTKTEVAVETLFVDDDDNIHVVFHNHKNARPIAARVEVIKQLKENQKI